MGQMTRRAALLAGGMLLGGFAGAKLTSKVPPTSGTKSLLPGGAEGTLNDASLLNETPVAKHIVMRENPGASLIRRVREEIEIAREEGRSLNIGAARHSMGGHAIPRDGNAVTFNSGFTEFDSEKGTYRVHAGARWAQVIAGLDRRGFGPKVMQSNNDFGVAATFCVNAHGWAVPHGPMGATVKSIFMVRADGEVVRCSRTENAPLFFLTMGGYGLTGAIIEMEVEAEPNINLVPTYQEMPSRDFAKFFVGGIESGGVNMAYGRLNVDREQFFEDALMITYRAAEDQQEVLPAAGSGALSRISRSIFRSQLMNETAKNLRWWFETDLEPSFGGGPVSRNTLINEPVATLDDKDPTRTDILHEYFVPPGRFPDFIDACQAVIPASYQEMLNITLRYVTADPESVLAYAPASRIACVMLFSQEMTARAEADHARMTRELIDRVLDMGGTYYLPYRPHATRSQFLRAYPRAREFVAEKRFYDPELIFRNGFWDNYLRGLG